MYINMCANVYEYIYMCVSVCVWVCVCVCVCVRTRISEYIWVCLYFSTYLSVNKFVCKYENIHTHTPTNLYIYIYAYIHTHTHTHAYIYIYIYTYLHIQGAEANYGIIFKTFFCLICLILKNPDKSKFSWRALSFKHFSLKFTPIWVSKQRIDKESMICLTSKQTL